MEQLWPDMDLAERYERAGTFFDAGDYRTAHRLLVDVVAAEPGHLAARLLLARAYFHTAQLRRAEEQFRHVIDRDPTESYAYLALGRTLQRAGRTDEAAGYLRIAEALGSHVE